MVRLQSTFHKLWRFINIGPKRQLLLIEAVISLAVARAALMFVPFPRLARRMGRFVPPADAKATTVILPEHVSAAREVRWAVFHATHHVPFKAVCLPRAMAARVMLNRRSVPSVLHFGATKGTEKPLNAHAWLDAAGVEVTGYPLGQEFIEVACFI